MDLSALVQHVSTEDEAKKKVIADAMMFKGEWTRVGDTPSMLGSGINKSYIAIIPQPEYKIDDLVVFKRTDGGRTIHPVTAVKEGHVFTKGTFNRVGDGWIPLSQVVGKVSKGYKTK